jgi:hypothetical protein
LRNNRRLKHLRRHRLARRVRAELLQRVQASAALALVLQLLLLRR